MARPIIEVRDLGKRYRLHNGRAPYRTLRESIMGLFQRERTPANSPGGANSNGTFWALENVSFDVHEGEVLGVVGHNGAGKTTLLRLLSRITEPTTGYFRLRGRIGSLLEVGTGFHPELSGRENVFLNGAILGMTRGEIARKFDEIVAFAEVEKFIDAPVKHYSSGMYLRLAFAVAAHLEPEILLVDEVLAVGDAAFQKKCLGKMQDVAGQGRTVLFVSHNLAAVANLCGRCLWLSGGRVVSSGRAGEVIQAYLDSTQSGEIAELLLRADRRGNGRVQFEQIWLTDRRDQVIDGAVSGAALQIHLRYRVSPPGKARNVIAAIIVRDLAGGILFTLSTHLTHAGPLDLEGEGVITCQLPQLPLVAGSYALGLWSSVGGELADEITEATQITVSESDVFATGKAPKRNLHGPIFVDHHWSLAPASTDDDGEQRVPTGATRE